MTREESQITTYNMNKMVASVIYFLFIDLIQYDMLIYQLPHGIIYKIFIYVNHCKIYNYHLPTITTLY